MPGDDDDAYRPGGRAYEKPKPARKNRRTRVAGMMSEFVSKASRISRGGQHILKKTGPRPGATYNLATAGAEAGLKRAASEINTSQAIGGKRVRKQPGQQLALACPLRR